jgi:hypothetical protein
MILTIKVLLFCRALFYSGGMRNKKAVFTMFLLVLGVIGFFWGLSLGFIYGGSSSFQHDITMKRLSGWLITGSLLVLAVGVTLFINRRK